MATTETFANFRRDTDAVDRGGFGAEEIFAFRVYNHSETFDPASIAAGAELSSDFTVTGAAVGDFVMVAPGVDLTDLNMSAFVSAADTVTVNLGNATVGAIDLASSTWKFKVINDNI
jgi:hypothetical protein